MFVGFRIRCLVCFLGFFLIQILCGELRVFWVDKSLISGEMSKRIYCIPFIIEMVHCQNVYAFQKMRGGRN